MYRIKINDKSYIHKQNCIVNLLFLQKKNHFLYLVPEFFIFTGLQLNIYLYSRIHIIDTKV